MFSVWTRTGAKPPWTWSSRVPAVILVFQSGVSTTMGLFVSGSMTGSPCRSRTGRRLTAWSPSAKASSAPIRPAPRYSAAFCASLSAPIRSARMYCPAPSATARRTRRSVTSNCAAVLRTQPA